MRLPWLAIALAGCQQTHVVTLALDPEDALSTGFACTRDDSSELLVRRGEQSDGSFAFSVVIDMISLDEIPICRGSELTAACTRAGSRCEIAPGRTCRRVTVDQAAFEDAVGGDISTALAMIVDQLDDAPVTLDAPDGPVLVRMVGTTEPCEELGEDFDPCRLVGCAFSCPTLLDEVDGAIDLSLDTVRRGCEVEVMACAAYPAPLPTNPDMTPISCALN